MPKTARARKKNKCKIPAIPCLFILSIISGLLIGMLIANVISNKTPATPLEYEKLQISYNTTPLNRKNRDIDYIVIHDTDNPAKTATARNHYKYFNSGNQNASADFFVDDTEILQINDYYTYYTWHCGDGDDNSKIQNHNSVAIEICVNKGGDYEKAVDKAVALTKELMDTLDVDIKHIVRHKDASGKNCPRSMSEDDWNKFLERVKKK